MQTRTLDRLTSLVVDEGLDPKRNLPRLYNCVKTVFPNAEFHVMSLAAKILGRIVRGGGSIFGEAFMDFEVPGSLQFLQADNNEGRCGGILILKELAICNTTVFSPHAPLVLEKLLTPLRDPSLQIREAAAEVLSICLKLWQSRERRSADPTVLTKILQEAWSGLKAQSNAVEVVHGSLLIFWELFKESGDVSPEAFTFVFVAKISIVHERLIFRNC